ncbi:MAG: class 1 fructose-bisphosphatase [Bacteroidota bacterium]
MTQDTTNHLLTLEEFIIRSQNRFDGATGELSQLLRDIGLAAKIVSREVNKAGITNLLGQQGSRNVHGENVKKLDLFADEQILSALRRSGIVSLMISEESNELIRTQSPSGKYLVFFDPLDGSSNIDVNVSVGTIFSIYRRKSSRNVSPEDSDALQPGDRQAAAGYVLYGSSTMLVYTTGMGVSSFTLDPSIGEFMLTDDDIRMPESSSTYSVNEGNASGWPEGIRSYIEHIKQVDPGSNRPYSLRYIGSMVSDLHRTLLLGGIFLYPPNVANPKGKLRLMYECNPMGYIMEQAGGLAVDGRDRVLEINPENIHQTSPVYMGSRKNVEELMAFLKGKK